MVFRFPPDRVRTTTTSQGTGSITIQTTADPGYRTVQSTISNGESTSFAMVMTETDAGGNVTAVIWEEFIGTRDGNVISRDSVIANSNGNTSKIDFGPGTKDVFATAPGSLLVFNSVNNVFTSDQTFRGKVIFGSTSATYLSSTAASGVYTATLTLGDVPHTISTANGQEITRTSTEDAYGPDLKLTRVRASGVGTDTRGPRVVLRQSDNVGSVQDLGSFDSYWRNLSGGGNASVDHQVLVNGVPTTQLTNAGGNGIQVRNTSLLVGKTTMGALQTAGTEVKQSGQINVTVAGDAPIIMNRLTDDGEMMAVYRGSTKVAQVTVSSGTVTWGSFHGGHPACLPSGSEVPDYIAPGTVMVTDDEPHPYLPHLSCARMASKREDPGVLGVFNTWMEPRDGHDFGEFLIGSVGIAAGVLCVGPVRKDDLLVTSAVAGHAEAWRWSWKRFWRLWPNQAAVLGKVIRSDPRSESRIVHATVTAG